MKTLSAPGAAGPEADSLPPVSVVIPSYRDADLLRLSVGLEDVQDVIEDLAQALDASRESLRPGLRDAGGGTAAGVSRAAGPAR